MKKNIILLLALSTVLVGCEKAETKHLTPTTESKTTEVKTVETETKQKETKATTKEVEQETSTTESKSDKSNAPSTEETYAEEVFQQETEVVGPQQNDGGYRYLENGRVAHMDEGEHAGGPILHGDDEENDRRMAEENIPYDIETNEYVYGKTDDGLTIGDTDSGVIQNEIANNTVYDDDWFNTTHEVEPEW